MKLSSLSLSELKAKHGRYLAAACKVWAEIERREKAGNTEQIDLDVSQFKDTTNRLLTEFLNAPDKILSKEDIRQDVILDEYASENAVMSAVKRARKEMQACRDCHYEIRNMKRRGYKLVRKETCHNLSRTPKTPRNKRKKDDRV